MKVLGWAKILGSVEKFWCKVPIGLHGFKVQSTNLNLNFGSGQKFWVGTFFWVQVKILGQGENFGFG